jgi:cytochrome P450
MPLSPALREKVRGRQKKPFRGLLTHLIAGFLNRPRLAEFLLRYGMPRLQRILDLTPYFLVTTHRNVREAMGRDDDFPIGPEYGPSIVCGAFVLGSDRGPQYREDLALLWEAFYGIPPRDLPNGVLPVGATTTKPLPRHLPSPESITEKVAPIIQRAEGAKNRQLDLVQEFLRPVSIRVMQEHLGLGPADDEDWIKALWDVLASLGMNVIIPCSNDLSNKTDPAVADLLWAKSTLLTAIDEEISLAGQRHGTPAPLANITGRMYGVLARKRLPQENIHETVRRNIAGLAVVGSLPMARAAAQAVDYLLDNKLAFDGAADAARRRNQELFWDYLDEALRFFPAFPLAKRACPRDAVIGADGGQLRKVRAGQTVTIGLLPGMFDANAIPFPYQFRTDRPLSDSLVFGRGMHACFGYQFVRHVLVAMLMPLFARGFVRVPGRKGRLSFDLLVPRSLGISLS